MKADANPTVLVVDDDAGVQRLLVQMLRRLGYAVLVASGGAAAVEVFEQYRRAVTLVLMDVRMPGMDGPATLAELRRLDPDINCCFVTGDPGRWTAADLRAIGAQAVLEKPFTADELSNVLAAV